MPVKKCSVDGKPGYKFGDRGKCYLYTPGDESSQKKAKARAAQQGAAIKANMGTHGIVTNAADPTRTLTLRTSLSSEIRKRWRKVRGKVRDKLDQNAFGLGFSSVEAETSRMGPPEERIRRFLDWLRVVLDQEILEARRESDGTIRSKSGWHEQYMRPAYMRGLIQASTLARGAGVDVDTQDGEGLLNRIHHKKAYRLGAEGVFRELEGTCAATIRDVSRHLQREIRRRNKEADLAANALVTLANDPLIRVVNKRIKVVGEGRGMIWARTEIVRLHADATLDRYEELGIDEVVGEVEFVTAGDGQVCPICRGLKGQTRSISAARGVIPVHPNCRCRWQPVVEEIEIEIDVPDEPIGDVTEEEEERFKVELGLPFGAAMLGVHATFGFMTGVASVVVRRGTMKALRARKRRANTNKERWSPIGHDGADAAEGSAARTSVAAEMLADDLQAIDTHYETRIRKAKAQKKNAEMKIASGELDERGLLQATGDMDRAMFELERLEDQRNQDLLARIAQFTDGPGWDGKQNILLESDDIQEDLLFDMSRPLFAILGKSWHPDHLDTPISYRVVGTDATRSSFAPGEVGGPSAAEGTMRARGLIKVTNPWSAYNYRSFAHEFAHALEDNFSDELHELARAFFHSRVRGEHPKPLSELIPGKNYRADEWAIPDDFISPYTGKLDLSNRVSEFLPDAGASILRGRVGESFDPEEIISTGIEWMVKDPVKFARVDPEHFELTLRILRGKDLWGETTGADEALEMFVAARQGLFGGLPSRSGARVPLSFDDISASLANLTTATKRSIGRRILNDSDSFDLEEFLSSRGPGTSIGFSRVWGHLSPRSTKHISEVVPTDKIQEATLVAYLRGTGPFRDTDIGPTEGELRAIADDLGQLIVGDWNASSRSDSSLYLMLAADREFDMPEATLGHLSKSLVDLDRKADAFWSWFVRDRYDRTQEFLRDQGVDEMILFRGIVLEEKIADGFSEPRSTPLSSWTADPVEAWKFAGRDGQVMMRRVKREDVWGVPQTGFGTFREMEYVLLGGRAKVFAMNGAEFRRRLTDQGILMEGLDRSRPDIAMRALSDWLNEEILGKPSAEAPLDVVKGLRRTFEVATTEIRSRNTMSFNLGKEVLQRFENDRKPLIDLLEAIRENEAFEGLDLHNRVNDLLTLRALRPEDEIILSESNTMRHIFESVSRNELAAFVQDLAGPETIAPIWQSMFNQTWFRKMLESKGLPRSYTAMTRNDVLEILDDDMVRRQLADAFAEDLDKRFTGPASLDQITDEFWSIAEGHFGREAINRELFPDLAIGRNLNRTAVSGFDNLRRLLRSMRKVVGVREAERRTARIMRDLGVDEDFIEDLDLSVSGNLSEAAQTIELLSREKSFDFAASDFKNIVWRRHVTPEILGDVFEVPGREFDTVEDLVDALFKGTVLRPEPEIDEVAEKMIDFVDELDLSTKTGKATLRTIGSRLGVSMVMEPKATVKKAIRDIVQREDHEDSPLSRVLRHVARTYLTDEFFEPHDLVEEIGLSMFQRWNQTTYNVYSQALHRAAIDEFDLDVDDFKNLGHVASGLHEDADELYNASPRFFQSIIRKMYVDTQEELAKEGIDFLFGFRGLKDFDLRPWEGGTVEVKTSPLTSWTPRGEIADNFSFSFGKSKEGHTLFSVIPREEVLALPRVGIGSAGEREFLVVGASRKVLVMEQKGVRAAVAEQFERIADEGRFPPGLDASPNPRLIEEFIDEWVLAPDLGDPNFENAAQMFLDRVDPDSIGWMIRPVLADASRNIRTKPRLSPIYDDDDVGELMEKSLSAVEQAAIKRMTETDFSDEQAEFVAERILQNPHVAAYLEDRDLTIQMTPTMRASLPADVESLDDITGEQLVEFIRSLEGRDRERILNRIGQMSGFEYNIPKSTPHSAAVNAAVNKVFGVGDPTIILENVRNMGISHYLRAKDFYDFEVQKIYQETQDYLKDQSIDRLILFRGLKKLEVDPGIHHHRSLPLASWTASPSTAYNFSSGPFGKAKVLITIADAEDVWGVPATGVGSHGLREVTLLGSSRETLVVTVDELEGMMGRVVLAMKGEGTFDDFIDDNFIGSVAKKLKNPDTSHQEVTRLLLQAGAGPDSDPQFVVDLLEDEIRQAIWFYRTPEEAQEILNEQLGRTATQKLIPDEFVDLVRRINEDLPIDPEEKIPLMNLEQAVLDWSSGFTPTKVRGFIDKIVRNIDEIDFDIDFKAGAIEIARLIDGITIDDLSEKITGSPFSNFDEWTMKKVFVDALELTRAYLASGSVAPQLYRGVDLFDVEIAGRMLRTVEDVLKIHHTGDIVDLRLSSFSSDRDIAEGFAFDALGVGGLENRIPVIYELEPGAQALRIETFVMNIFSSQREWLSMGRFEIVSIELDSTPLAEDFVRVRIRQVSPIPGS